MASEIKIECTLVCNSTRNIGYIKFNISGSDRYLGVAVTIFWTTLNKSIQLVSQGI